MMPLMQEGWWVYLLWGVGGAATGGAAIFLYFWLAVKNSQRTGQHIIQKAKEEAAKQTAAIESRGKEELENLRREWEKEHQAKKKDLGELESRLVKKDDNLNRKLDLLNKKERRVDALEKSLEKRTQAIEIKEQEVEQLIEEEKQVLYRTSGLGKEEAEKLLLQKLEKDYEHEQEVLINRMVERIKEQAEVRSREILATSIQRMASAYCQEITTSTIEIPNDEMKGRVIGREGRNIRAFEKATGVDVIVDDTPGVIIISCFDSIRREMARRAMDKLIADGRIHPTRIEEIVAQTKKEMNEIIQQEGKQTIYDLNIPGMHPKMVTLLGRLKFRTSYGQNVLHHVKECANLAGMIAAEIGLDVQLAKRCALLHDIGKAVDHEIEGGHPEIGANIAKRYDEPPEVVNSIASHHNDVPQETIYAVLTQAADSVSGSRPGARGETLERYIKRLEKLEAVVMSFAGVKSANAIQAGREIRVIVNSQKVSDKKAIKLCRDIAKEIEEQLTYPGEIKVTLLRETRVVEYAR
jgi:ribonuclease Y